MSRFKGVDDQTIRDVRTGWRQLVKDLGGVDATAKVAQTTISQVSIYGNPAGDSLPSLATVLAVEMDLGAGHAHVTEAMARATGHVLVPVQPIAEGDLATHLATLGAETGQVFARYAAALVDGKVCAEDRVGITRELQHVIHAASVALGHLQAAPRAVERQDGAA